MDVSSKSFQIHAIDGKKKVVYKDEIKPTKTGLSALRSMLGKEHVLFIFEAGNQLKWIADHINKMANTSLHVVHPNEIKWISQSSGKTDKIDARKLAELGRGDMLPRKVHVVEGVARDLREIASARQLVQSKRISLINCVRGFCKQEGHNLATNFFGKDDWRLALSKLKLSETLKQIIESIMPAFEALVVAEEKLTKQLCSIKDERIELIETIPAIGKLGSRVIIGAIDDVKRFDNKKTIAKYGALTPRLYQSGDLLRLGRISNDGRHEVRKILLQSAHCIARMKALEAKPLQEFYERIKKRAGKKRALIALCRKLLTTVYGVLKNKQTYNPKMLLADRAA